MACILLLVLCQVMLFGIQTAAMIAEAIKNLVRIGQFSHQNLADKDSQAVACAQRVRAASASLYVSVAQIRLSALLYTWWSVQIQ